VKVTDDSQIPSYPEWVRTEYTVPGTYAEGIWTKKEGWIYAIFEDGPISFVLSLSLQRRRQANINEKDYGWQYIAPKDYGHFFDPNEIDRLKMEMLL